VRRPENPGDRGSATIAVTLFGALAVLVGLSVVTQMVTEYRAVEDSLAQTRAYWAAMGQATYVLSHTMATGAATAANYTQNSLVTTENNYLKEITTGPKSLQFWMYPDISSAYQFTIQGTVCTDALAPALKSGELVIVFSFNGGPKCPTAPPGNGNPPACPKPAAPANGTPDSLRTINATRPVEIRYCLVGNSTDACGVNDLVANAGTYQFITSIHRPTC